MNNTETVKKPAKNTAKKAAKKKIAKAKELFGPDIYKRDEHGLLKNIKYVFNEDGSVDWRSMIKPEFLYPNKGWFDMRNQQVPTTIEGLKDNQLLVMLGGIKDLLRLRGYKHLSFEVENVSDGYVTANCNISFIGNYENEMSDIVYQDCANATIENTNAFCEKFLETIACNRALVRCVRNFLNIHIVGADEIDKSDTIPTGSSTQTASSTPITPSGLLEKILRDKHNVESFDDFKDILRNLWKNGSYLNENVKEWSSYSDISAKEARILISILSK